MENLEMLNYRKPNKDLFEIYSDLDTIPTNPVSGYPKNCIKISGSIE